MEGQGASPGSNSGLFDFSSGPGDQSVNSVWSAMQITNINQSGAFLPSMLGESGNPSRIVPRAGPLLLSGTTEKIRKSLATLDEVVVPVQSQKTSRPLLKESVRSGTPQQVGGAATPQSTPRTISLMDGQGVTRDILLEPLPQFTPAASRGPAYRDLLMETHQNATFMDQTAADQSFLNTTLFGNQTQRGAPTADPVEKTTSALVSSFHEAFSQHSAPGSCLELMASLSESCDEEISRVQEHSPSLRNLLTDLVLERNTWKLMSVLYTDRIEEQAFEEDMETILFGGGQSHREISANFFSRDSTVRQAQLVVDWLESNARGLLDSYPVKVNYLTDNVCWENTVHSLTRTGDTLGLVSEMDPDAPRRQSKHLADLDEKDEQSLLKHLFTCVRAGEIAKAQEICVQCGQSWRACSLEGWRLHHDPNYGKDVRRDGLEPVEGNLTRDMWKVCCWNLSGDPKMNVHERAMYAALSGNTKQILPACNNWLDYVWSYFKAMVDVLTERKLRGATSGGLSLEQLPNDYWNAILAPEVIFQEIEATPNAVIAKQCRNPFHIVQKYVILGDLEGLVGVMHEWLQEQCNIHQLRFMAHVVLFAQALEEVQPEDDRCTDILQAYVQGLIGDKYHKFVALYTSRLPRQQQITSYATLLEGTEDPESQRECLELGKAYRLDIPGITKSVVERVRNTGVEEGVAPLGPELLPHSEITKLDTNKIEVIRWLIIDKGQRAEAIKQGNALMRQFLATKKMEAAEALFRKLPADSVQVVRQGWERKSGGEPLPADLTNDIHEFMCIEAYLKCNTTFNSWFQHFHTKKPEHPSEPRSSNFKENVVFEQSLKQYQSKDDIWRYQLDSLTEDAETCLKDVLLFGTGWMVDPQESTEVDEQRTRQLALLREICIPRVAFLLHTVLDSTQQTRKCLQLADIIASEQFQLYKVFRQQELERLLSLLHKTAISALSDKHNDLGYPL